MSRRRPRLSLSIIDICLGVCDQQIADLQKQRALLVAERDAAAAAEDKPKRTKRQRAVTSKPTAVA